MTYNPGIPQPTDKPSQSQSQFLENFGQLNTIFAANHVTFNDATAANRGKHTFVVLNQQVSGAVTSSTDGALYTKSTTNNSITAPNLFWRMNSSGSEVPMTVNVNPSTSVGPPTQGVTFLPGNILMQYGTRSINGNTTATITFSGSFPPFSATPYSVQVTMERSSSGASQNFFIVAGSVTSTQFQISNSNSNAHLFYWIAIGPA